MTTSNISVLSVDAAVKTLSGFFKNAINSGVDFKTIPSVMLWGAPGVGKSQGVREIASVLEKETGKRVCITDVRLLLFNPIDLRGIPTADKDKTLAVWLKPKLFQMDENPDIVNILFLDEISAAPQTVQAAAYQITLDRVVGEHKLPDNCLVIAAGNRVTDKSVSYKMPKALANRLMHFEIEGSFSSWQNWAVTHGINSRVLGYLSFRNDRLFGFDSASDDLAFATPRSWEMVSNVLNYLDNDLKSARPLIAGLIGTGNSVEFCTWCNVYRKLPSIEDIFSGRENKVPRETDALYALIYAITDYAKSHFDEKTAIGNSICYASKMPFDFANLLVSNYKAIKGKEADSYLLSIPEYARILERIGDMENGNK